MSMNDTPSGERIHIGIFGKRNAGKSSLLNAITGQHMAIVSDIKGTTTDPVKKAIELLPLGPVVLIDTPGLDDEGVLGQERVGKSMEMLRQTDLVVLVISAEELILPVDGMDLVKSHDERVREDALEYAKKRQDFSLENAILDQAKERDLPTLVCFNKADLLTDDPETEGLQGISYEQMKESLAEIFHIQPSHLLFVSAEKQQGIHELKEAMAHAFPKNREEPALIRDLLNPEDLVVLVVPIDSAAPKGRLILPQQQVIRDALEAGAVPVVTRETELDVTLKSLAKPPKLVVTDSQVFGRVAKEVPENIPLTSFSILMARYKGDLKTQIAGARAIEDLKDGDTVLISEGCTHHRQCEDIGTVKMPRWIRDYTGKDIRFAFTSGTEFPRDLSPYALVVHCGGCTLNPQEMRYRIAHGAEEGVPITNYGVMIAYIHGILPRVTTPFTI
jgi:[FeFe] hydrogenase H-cluster maturation GTPase HydF